MAFVDIGWILFRADTPETAWIIMRRIFTLAEGVPYVYVFTLAYGLLFVIVNVWVLIKKKGRAGYIFLDYHKFSSWFILWTVILLALVLFYPGEAEFIYGRF